ncbi:MAG: hypothetical protein AB1810_09095 [Pseudomonadota bacterium]
MNPVFARLFICGLIAAPTFSEAADDDLAALRAAREANMGPVIAAGADYTVHSPQAARAGNTVRCAVQTGNAMSDEAFNARLNAIRETEARAREPLDEEKAALMNARRARPPMSDQEFAPKWASLQAREKEIALKAHAEDKKLQEEWANSRRTASHAITLYLQHAPRDPNATIVPLEGIAPSSAFVAELNALLRPFLSTCPDSDWVSAAHYFRDATPFGKKGTQAQLDPHIIMFRYILRAGNLSLNKAPEYFGETQRINNDPVRNPRLTLAGLQASNQARSIETGRRSAVYRKDYETAAKRQPGIVYKLDPYWRQYKKYDGGYDEGKDTVRRVFDGDFARQKESDYFKAHVYLFSSDYSRQCKSEIPNFTRFKIPSPAIVGTRTYADGHVENVYGTTIITVDIDSRFAPFYEAYRKVGLPMYLGIWSRKAVQISSSILNSSMEDLGNGVDTTNVTMWSEFFRQHKCTSATMLQMRDNLLRAANSQRSAQDEGIRYPGAEQESDPPPR